MSHAYSPSRVSGRVPIIPQFYLCFRTVILLSQPQPSKL